MSTALLTISKDHITATITRDDAGYSVSANGLSWPRPSLVEALESLDGPRWKQWEITDVDASIREELVSLSWMEKTPEKPAETPAPVPAVAQPAETPAA